MGRKETITTALETLHPAHLEVVNESHMHSVAPDSETHFKIIVVSDAFATQSLVTRHRTVNQLLAAELAAGLHALSIHAFSPTEWEKNLVDTSSPFCRGGAGK